MAIKDKHPGAGLKVRGRGLIYGLEMPRPELAKAASREAFQKGLIIELAGPQDEVLKFLPPLVIDDQTLKKGIGIISGIIDCLLASKA